MEELLKEIRKMDKNKKIFFIRTKIDNTLREADLEEKEEIDAFLNDLRER